LPQEERQWLIAEEGASEQAAAAISADKVLVDGHKELRSKGMPAKGSFVWIMGLVLQQKNELSDEQPNPASYFRADAIFDLNRREMEGTMSGTAARAAYPEILKSGETVDEYVQRHGEQISDESSLAAAVDEVIAEHQDAVENYRKGNENSLKFLVGQVMRKSKGRANPQLVNRLLEERLKP